MSSSPSPWLTRAEAAKIARVSVRTIDRARRAGELRANRPAGGRVLIRRDSFVEWLTRGGPPPG